MRLLLLLLTVVAVLLALTNPGPERYEAFVEDTAARVIAAEVGGVPGGGVIGQVGGALAARLATRYSERANYLLFSVYTIDLAGVGLPGEEWRFLGIGNQFLELHRPEALRD